MASLVKDRELTIPELLFIVTVVTNGLGRLEAALALALSFLTSMFERSGKQSAAAEYYPLVNLVVLTMTMMVLLLSFYLWCFLLIMHMSKVIIKAYNKGWFPFRKKAR